MDIRLARALEFERILAERRSTRVSPKPYGFVFFNDELPIVHDLNRALAVRAPVAAAQLIEDTTDLLGSIGRHGRADVTDAGAADDMTPAFSARGWERSDWLLMARDTVVDGIHEAIREADVETVVSFDEQIALLDYGEETARQLTGRTRLALDAMHALAFARFVDETPVTMCRLYIDGPTACIDSVDTLEEHRGKGFAQAAITVAIAAARSAGADLVFLVVEPDNEATNLYQRLGFERIGITAQFDAPS